MNRNDLRQDPGDLFNAGTKFNAGTENGPQFSGLLRAGLGASRALACCSPEQDRSTHGEGSDPPAPVKSFIARHPHEVAQARALVRKRYARQGYEGAAQDGAPFPDAVRAAYYPTIVARSGAATVGTVIMGVDSSAGLLIDEENKREADVIRAEGGRVCELVKLALEDSADTKVVLCSLLQCIYTLCWRVYDVTDVLVEVIPRHVPFYRRVLGFVQASDEKRCTRVGGVPVVLLRLARDDLEHRLSAFVPARDGVRELAAA
jgi:hypothetical protein